MRYTRGAVVSFIARVGDFETVFVPLKTIFTGTWGYIKTDGFIKLNFLANVCHYVMGNLLLEYLDVIALFWPHYN